MKLNLIYGRAGVGKSRYVYESIKDNFGKSKIYLIVPEQFNLTAEKNLFDVLGKEALIDTEVLTLSRMAYRVSCEVEGKEDIKLSKAGKSMIIYDILSKEKTNLQFLGNSDKNIDIIDRLFTELKKHKVNIEDLRNLETEDQYLKLKVNDVLNLYDKYEEKIINTFLDEEDLLDNLIKNISKSYMFDDVILYFDEFIGFTKQEYRIFEELMKKAKSVYFTVTTDSLDIGKKENDIFYFNKKHAEKLINISHDLNYEVNEISLNNKENKKYSNGELEFLEKHLFFDNKRYEKNVENIKLFLAKNPYSEIEYVSKNIYNLVKNCGLRYNEIGIISEDVEKYAEDVKVIFKKYDIPIFVDVKKDLNQNILIRFIMSVIDVLDKNFSYDTVIDLFKIGLFDIEKEKIYLLENYTTKWNIRGKKWKEKFEYEEINNVQTELDEIREKYVLPLINLRERLQKNRTFEEISKEIYLYLVDNNITVNLENKLELLDDEELKEEYVSSYKIIVEILEEINEIFKDEVVSFDKYKEIFRVGIISSDLGKIPLYQDVVIFGDTERSRNKRVKVVFIIGLNDGMFPKRIVNEGFLNDKDRIKLSDSGIELARNSIDDLYEREFEYYRTFSLPEDKLFITYSSADKDGSSLRPSIMLKRIKRIFVNIKEESDVVSENYEITNKDATFEEALKVYKEYLDGEIDTVPDEWMEVLKYFYKERKRIIERCLKGVDYNNLSVRLNKDNVDKLYRGTLVTSISKIESYKKCPFSYHLKYGLKLEEKEELKIDSKDTGTFMHEVIEKFFDFISDNNIDVKTIEDKDVEAIINTIINSIIDTSRYYKFNSSKRFMTLTLKLKRVTIEAIKYLVYSIRYSDFKILSNEVSFGKNGKYDPIKIELDDGRNVEITGKIDRVDVAKLDNNQYVRIIDYKSSIKNIDLNQVVAGLQIQLITYLDAISEKESMIPSGVLYMSLIDNIVKADKRMTEEEIEQEIKKNYKMQGMILGDVKVVKMMDNRLHEGMSSDIIPAAIGKSGELNKSNSLLDEKYFTILRRKVKSVIKELSNEIVNGNIDIHPYYYKKHTGCEYCSYRAICAFNPSIKNNEYNIIKNTKRDIILERLEGEYKD